MTKGEPLAIRASFLALCLAIEKYVSSFIFEEQSSKVNKGKKLNT